MFVKFKFDGNKFEFIEERINDITQAKNYIVKGTSEKAIEDLENSLSKFQKRNKLIKTADFHDCKTFQRMSIVRWLIILKFVPF